MSTIYLSSTIGRVNLADRIYAIMDNFLKILHFFKGEREREREGREEVTFCSVLFGEDHFSPASMALRPPFAETS